MTVILTVKDRESAEKAVNEMAALYATRVIGDTSYLAFQAVFHGIGIGLRMGVDHPEWTAMLSRLFYEGIDGVPLPPELGPESFPIEIGGDDEPV